jgi:KDO2-lipid IV(A) lauroyltransferase
MDPAPPPSTRCGIDTVEVARIEKLLRETAPADLRRFFSEQELADSGEGDGRAASLAARFAAKEACSKLFPRETALGTIEPTDFSVRKDGYGAPQIEPTPAARAVMDRCFISEIRVSLTHSPATASAVAVAETKPVPVPWFGKFVYHCLPVRRGVVMENLRRVFGAVLPEEGIQRLAQAYYGHFIRFLGEFLRLPWMSAKRKKAMIRVENMEVPLRAHAQGKGMLLLTGHFGNWEVATVAGIGAFSQFKGLFHFVRRPLKPALLNHYVTWRFRRSGFGTIAKRGSLDTILDLLAKERIIVFVYDQHATGREGVVVDFLGHPASTFKSLAIIAMTTGAPVIPAYSWREPDGTHVFRFEEPVPIVEHENTSEAIRLNTRAFNSVLERMLLRHPEQWIWMHQRWKADPEWVRREAAKG